MSDSLQPHGLYYTRLPYPSQSPGVCWNSCLLSQWCHPIISSSISPLSSCLQSFPASGSLLMSRFFASGDQSIGASASASVLPMNIQGWFLLGLTSLISREGNGTPLQYSCLENPMDGGAWKAAVHGVAEGRTQLSDFTFTFHFHALEKEMATHSSVLAWRIPGMGGLVGCCLWGHTESDTTEVT